MTEGTARPTLDRELLEARKAYNEVVGYVLWQFQLIEETLKTYLDITFDLIRARTSDVLVCKWSRRDLENAPLGRLINQFEQFTDDDPLVLDLRALSEERNHCAHRAFVRARREENTASLLMDVKRFADLKAQVESLLERMHARLTALGETCTREGV